MNIWGEKTLEIVRKSDYLDQILKIYPNQDGQRNVRVDVLSNIRKLYEEKEEIKLLELLLKFEKFPYKDSYIGFLRKEKDALRRNPVTVDRICKKLMSMGVENIIHGISIPKEANTMRGNQFRKWLKETYRSVPQKEFLNSKEGIVLLDASELHARDFCNSNLNAGITKRPDIVAKSGDTYVIGEAKFLSTTGGNQGRAFDDGIKLASSASGNARKIFVLDGANWIEKGSYQYKSIDNSSSLIFSALLLDEYLSSL